MIWRIVTLLFFLSIINAQIALPTFQGVHKPQSTSSSSDTLTFTNCGATGRDGPTQSQSNSTYSGTSLDGNVTISSGFQLWTVPSSGSYQIEVWGAQGGRGGVDDPIVEGGAGADANHDHDGGFGGGGGGYQGGNASARSWSSTGQSKGGYSYNSGTDKADSSTLGYNSDQGKIIITKL